MALFAESRASCHPDHDFLLLRDHHCMAAFWVVHCAALIYLGALSTWVALILRHDPRSRPVSRALLIGLALGACGIVGFALPWLNTTGWPSRVPCRERCHRVRSLSDRRTSTMRQTCSARRI